VLAVRPKLQMDWKSRGVFAAERTSYPRWYHGDFEGKTVLSVGEGCGETAAYFLSLGASKVVCVERDRLKVAHFLNNAVRFHWNVKVLAAPFSLPMLQIPHDFLKFDAEGAEALLLDYNGSLGPCAIETHEILAGRGITRKLAAKFNLRTRARVTPTTWVIGT
jgi:hypothetical protein